MVRRGLAGLFDTARDVRRALMFVLLTTAAGATEGLGLFLLVPMLSAFGQEGAQAPLARWLNGAGVPFELGPLLLAFVALIVLRSLLVMARTLAAQTFEFAVIDRLRIRAWDSLLHSDWRTLAGMHRAENTSVLIGEIERVGIYLNQGIAAAVIGVTLTALAIAAFAISPIMALAAGIAGFTGLIGYRRMRRRAGGFGQRLGQTHATIQSRVQDSLMALRIIKSITSEDRTAALVEAEYAGLRKVQRVYLLDLVRSQAVLHSCGAAILALLVWLAIDRWQIGIVQALPMVALFARAIPLLAQLQQALGECAHARPALDTALALIDRAEAAREPDALTAPPGLNREIVLDAVTVHFKGEAEPALDRITATIPARGITAITGPSGAGKSTLADLIGGLLAPDAGTVRIDDTVLEGPLRRAWRSRVAYVQQDPVLLSATLRDNLRWAAPAADDQALRTALEAASASFALDLPQGLDTLLGDGGRQLSGGERQRLMLARALLRDPALLILDEATSALDAENEARIAEALLGLKTRMAVVVIGHRGVLPALADHEIRLEGGHCIKAS